MTETVRIGTRGSELALWQANHVKAALEGKHPGLVVVLEVITTDGDRIQDRPLHEVGGKGLFVKGIEEKLLDGSVDLAVHSMKDLPAEMPAGLVVACTPVREDPRDALCGRDETPLAQLAAGTRVGTGSLRRSALALRVNPKIEIVPLRGNVPTRLRKVGVELDAVILAAAGLRRLGLAEHITEALDLDRFCPAPTQGVLALQCRSDDLRVRELVKVMSDPTTTIAATAERAFLSRLHAGCTVPVGCYAELRAADVLVVSGLIVGPGGRPYLKASKTGAPSDAAVLGTDLAETLLGMGGQKVIDDLDQASPKIA
jgi:hydroxymethylbilane synthase